MKNNTETTGVGSRNAELIFSAMVDGMYVVTKDYKIDFMNKVLIDTFGDQTGKICYQAFYGSKKPCLQCNPPAVLRGNIERWVWDSDKQDKAFEFTQMPMRNADGTIAKLTIFRDITKQKRLEKSLKKSEERYRSLIESADDSIYLIDRDCRYLFMNAKHLSRLGIQEDQVISRTYGEYHSEEEVKEFAELISRIFETGKPDQQEYRSSRDGKYFLRTASPVRDAEGKITAVTVISKDISSHKEVDDERKRLLKELVAKNREMEHFAYTVSHDLRSPLITIQGFANMLRSDLGENKRENAEMYLVYIETAAAKMDTLLTDRGRPTN